MPTYAALIYEPQGQNGHQNADIVAEYRQFMAEASEAGVLVVGHPLRGTETAQCVRVTGSAKGGPVTITDGPFAETKEILAGFFLLDCKDQEDANRWAARIPHAWHGTMEVRPVAD